MLKQVDLNWPPDQIREFCESQDTWALELPEEWTADEVEALYRRQLTVSNPYIGVISEIAADPRVGSHTLNDIWSRFGTVLEVASALAVNPSTPATLRRQLAQHPEEVVREHAKAKIQRLPGPVYAIVRIDAANDVTTPLEDRITVTGVVTDLVTARSEAMRLNQLNASKGCRYFWRATRLKNKQR